MKKLFSISLLFVLAAALGFGQTATPSTTLCAAATATAKSVCLTAVTNVVNQTGLYIDAEYMVVNLSNSQTIAAGGYVPVIRGARAAGSGPASHANGAVVWEALTPDKSLVPGSNGFQMGTQLGDVGTCVRANELYLPKIWPNRGVKRDCSTGGYWVEYAGYGQDKSPFAAISAATATIAAAAGNYILTKADGTTAITLTAPTAGTQDGATLAIYSGSAEAHTVVCSSCLATGGTNVGTMTFAAYAGAGFTLEAYNGKWMIVVNNLVTLTN